MGSLQDALRQAGLSESKKKPKKKPTQAAQGRGGGRGQTAEEIDLARAYRARQQAEKQQAEQKKKAKQQAQEARRQRNLALEKILDGQALNDPAAETPRFFEHLGRIRRVLCTPSQRDAINAGTLAIVMFRGRALLVSVEVASEVATLAADAVPDLHKKEPDNPASDENDYPPIPDDLIW